MFLNCCFQIESFNVENCSGTVFGCCRLCILGTQPQRTPAEVRWIPPVQENQPSVGVKRYNSFTLSSSTEEVFQRMPLQVEEILWSSTYTWIERYRDKSWYPMLIWNYIFSFGPANRPLLFLWGLLLISVTFNSRSKKDICRYREESHRTSHFESCVTKSIEGKVGVKQSRLYYIWVLLKMSYLWWALNFKRSSTALPKKGNETIQILFVKWYISVSSNCTLLDAGKWQWHWMHCIVSAKWIKSNLLSSDLWCLNTYCFSCHSQYG